MYVCMSFSDLNETAVLGITNTQFNVDNIRLHALNGSCANCGGMDAMYTGPPRLGYNWMSRPLEEDEVSSSCDASVVLSAINQDAMASMFPFHQQFPSTR